MSTALTDVGPLNLKASRQGNGVYPVAGAAGVLAGVPYTITTSADTNWLWTGRGRLGWLVEPQLLAYATGGVAITRLYDSFNYFDGNGETANGSAAATKVGWVVGGGLEWAFSNQWSVRAEYLYLDFGKITATGSIGGGYTQGIGTSADLTASIARLGVNYKF
jgi:outer membrane immunogenic protein